MSNPTSKPARWEWVPVDVSVALTDVDAHGPSQVARTFDLTNATGERIAQAIASIDLRRRLASIRELRYDASRATEAEAREALERFLAPPGDESTAEVAAEPPPTD